MLGTDIAAHAIDRARGEVRRPAIAFEVWDATQPPPFAGGFDLITAFEVVEHLDAPEAAIATWHELLRPGGALVLSTPNRLGPASRYWRDPTHVNVRTGRHWKRSIESAANWQTVDVQAVQWVPFAWRLSGRMRAFALPGIGATLRICAIKAAGI